MKRKSLFFSVFLILSFMICILVVLNYKTIRHMIPDSIKEKLPTNVLLFHDNIMVPLQTTMSSLRNSNYFYNVVFLPETHFASMNLKRYAIKNNDNHTDPIFSDEKTKYYLDTYDGNIFLTTYFANIFFVKQEKINDKNDLIFSKINSNLDDLKSKFFVLDSLVQDGNIFVSGFYFSEQDGKNCKKFRLYQAKLNYEKIKFVEIFNNDECAFSYFMQAGRMQKYTFDGIKGILFSMGENAIDKPNELPQDDKSDYGKMIFLNLETYDSQVFSKGHRNPQGLLVDGDAIISTEHGPLGGDEINKIIKGNNYGWPLASYGTYYNTDKKKYLKSHKKYGYTEPIFTFIPAVGISEIIKIPNKFIGEKDLNNLYFVSSLNARSLFLVKLDDKKERIIFSEKIFINQRIRDLKYIDEYNLVILALEHPSQLAVLKNNKN